MAYRIAFVSQTGNVMKTMLATATAAQLAKHDYSTTLIDTDFEHFDRGWSAHTFWLRRRARQPLRDAFECVLARSAEELDAAVGAHDACDVIVIDCPSRAHKAIIEIARAVDMTVLPIPTNEKDAILTAHCVETLIASGVDARRLALIPVRAHSAAEVTATVAWLRADFAASPTLAPIADRIAIHPAIHERSAYANALLRGLTIAEAVPVSLAAQASTAIESLIGQLGRLITPEQENAA